MGEEIGLFEAIHSQRAIRSVKPDPVPRDLIRKVVEAATKAPSAANSQPWAFVVVDDPGVRARLGPLAREGFRPMYESLLARLQPGDPLPMPRYKAMLEGFERVPAWVFACAVPRPGRSADVAALQPSVFPAVQNLLLAARGLGLGATLTGVPGLVGFERLREVLGLPGTVVPMAGISLGFPDQERYGPTTRRPVGEVLHWNTWDPGKAGTLTSDH